MTAPTDVLKTPRSKNLPAGRGQIYYVPADRRTLPCGSLAADFMVILQKLSFALFILDVGKQTQVG